MKTCRLLKKLIFFIFSFGVLTSVFLQPIVQKKRGQIIDEQSKISLPRATIALLEVEPPEGVITGGNGYFVQNRHKVAAYFSPTATLWVGGKT